MHGCTMFAAFRSLHVFNYRAWAIGALVSNLGTWMQRTAQDWIVLTELSDRSAKAVGVVMALQFAPQLLLLPWTGVAADKLDRRKLLFATQAASGALALGLGVLTLTGSVRLWHVDAFAFLLGCATAFDAPARHTFVAELVPDADLPNAVALNSTSFNAARLIGPALGGLAIAAFGSGWVFVLNGVSFGAVLVALQLLRRGELRPAHARRAQGNVVDGVRYVFARPDLAAVMLMLFCFGTFGLNFPIFISTMAVSVFHRGAGEFGLATSIMAIGSVAGALTAAAQATPRMGRLVAGCGVFGAGLLVAALMPSYLSFSIALIAVGGAAQTFTTTANATVQLATDPAMRGRVMSLFMAIALGGTPLGAPIVGWVADTFGPRWALGVGVAGGAMAAAIGLLYLARTNARAETTP